MILLLGVFHVHCNVFEQVAVKLAFTIQKVIKCSEQICRAIGSTTRGHCSVPEQGTTFLQSTFPNRENKAWNLLPKDLQICTDSPLMIWIKKGF